MYNADANESDICMYIMNKLFLNCECTFCRNQLE